MAIVPKNTNKYIEFLFSVILISLFIIGATLTKQSSHGFYNISKDSYKCETNDRLMVFKNTKGSYIRVVSNLHSQTMLPDVQRRYYRRYLANKNPNIGLNLVQPGQYLLSVFDLVEPKSKMVYVILDEDPAPYFNKFITLCAQPINNRLYKGIIIDQASKTEELGILNAQNTQVDTLHWKTPTWIDTTALIIQEEQLIANHKGPEVWGKSGGVSQNRLKENEDGTVQTTIKEIDKSRVIGFSQKNINHSFGTVDYAIHLSNKGELVIFEKGEKKGKFGKYQINDLIEITRLNNKIIYKKNNQIFYTSPTPSFSELMIDVCFFNKNATLFNIKASFD